MRTTRQLVTITGTDRVQGDPAPQGLKKVKQNNGPITTAVTAKEPESQVDL